MKVFTNPVNWCDGLRLFRFRRFLSEHVLHLRDLLWDRPFGDVLEQHHIWTIPKGMCLFFIVIIVLRRPR